MGMAEESKEGRPPTGAERRGAVRHPADLRMTCYPEGGGAGAGRGARVRNLSRTGVALLVDRSWQPGTVLTVCLAPDEEGRTRSWRARVVHATAQPGGRFLVGCSFATALTEDELQALLAASP
jgi:hypothetical protein